MPHTEPSQFTQMTCHGGVPRITPPTTPQGVSASFLRLFVKEHMSRVGAEASLEAVRQDLILPALDACKSASKPFTCLFHHAQDDAGAPLVGPATVFLAHARGAPFRHAVEVALSHAVNDPTAYFWIDIFCLPARMSPATSAHWASHKLSSHIEAIGTLLFVAEANLGDARSPFRCAWSLWALFCAVDRDVDIFMQMPADLQEEFSLGAPEFFRTWLKDLWQLRIEDMPGMAAHFGRPTDVEEAPCDVQDVARAVVQRLGGADEVNFFVRSEMVEWLLEQLEQLVDDIRSEHQEVLMHNNADDESHVAQAQDLPDLRCPAMLFVQDFYDVGANFWAALECWDAALGYLEHLLAMHVRMFGRDDPASFFTFLRIVLVCHKTGEERRCLQLQQLYMISN